MGKGSNWTRLTRDPTPQALRTNWPSETRIKGAIPATEPVKRETQCLKLSPTALGMLETAVQECAYACVARGDGATRDEMLALLTGIVTCRIAGHPVRITRRAQGRVATARAKA